MGIGHLLVQVKKKNPCMKAYDTMQRYASIQYHDNDPATWNDNLLDFWLYWRSVRHNQITLSNIL